MSPGCLDRFLGRLRAEYPDYPLAVRRYSSPDDPTIEHSIDILLVPASQLHAVAWHAWELTEEVYGDDATPFVMGAVDPESSEEYFAEELEKARGQWIQTFLRFPLDASTFSSLIYPAMGFAPAPAGHAPAAESPAQAINRLKETVWSDMAAQDPERPSIGATLRAVETLRPEDPLQRRYPYAA
jgi:hypothetical protein